MRNVVFVQFISLDGVAEEPGDWFIEDGPELFDNIAQIIETQDDVLLGRRTYDYWFEHWPTSDLEPFAPFINATR
jgi:dihydrofolate reductase